MGTEYRMSSFVMGSVSKGLLFLRTVSTIPLPFHMVGCPSRGSALEKTKRHPAATSPNGSTAAPDADQSLIFERETASGNTPESLLLPSRPDCWLRSCTELAFDRSRAVTASREHARFRRKLYAFSVSWPCGAVNTSCGQKRACIHPKGGRITLWAAMKILPFYGRRLRCGMV